MGDVPKKVRELVRLFETNFADYKKPSFNEAQLRRQFLDPFFEALGWDVANTKGYSEQYKEVVHEDSLKDQGRRSAPDYSFRIGKERKFFVEAKRPAVDLSKDKSSAYQLRRYAWSSDLPLSVVTDFEEFAIYDTRIKPYRTDSPKKARIQFLRFTDYENQWSELEDLLSPEAIRKGAFERFIENRGGRRGTTPVDRDFLSTIEGWRSKLARAVFKSNPSLDGADLTSAVQTLIDRILFLRICEDKGIEKFGALADVRGRKAYDRLRKLFGDAQRKYNAGLFHVFKENASDRSFDSLSDAFLVPDKVISEIINGLYFPDSDYEFSVISPEILGSVYERFLGSIITVTGRTVRVELKPELKKADGVYYTPRHVVRYMVTRTLDPLLQAASGKSDFLKIRILDMACGSGSFLMEAYGQLLEWYLAWHIGRGRRSAKYLEKVPDRRGNGFNYHLSLSERRRILLEHIFGVDIDPQAVEVSKLSLFLKLIEDTAVLPAQFEFAPFHSRILPDMNANIRCGNSIVAPDVLESVILTEEELQRTKPFDWNSKDGFSAAMAAGGFDLIVGNPPYSYRNATFDKFKAYYKSRYASTEGNFDTYKMFLERCTHLLKQNGKMCQIVNSSFLIQPQFALLRQVLDERLKLNEIDVMGPNVFDDVTIDTAIVRGTATRSLPQRGGLLVKEPPTPLSLTRSEGASITQRRFRKTASRIFDWRLSDSEAGMVTRLIGEFPRLDSVCDLSVGINTGMMKQEMVATHKRDARYHPCVPGDGISRYGGCETDGWIIYDPDVIRAAGARGRSLPPERFFDQHKILIVRTRSTSLKRRIVATLDEKRKYNLNRLSNVLAKPGTDLYTILGVINSELWNFIFSTRFFNYEIKPVFLREAPVATASDSNLGAMARERMSLENDLVTATSDIKRSTVTLRIDALEKKIDALVYQLFGLSSREVIDIRTKLANLPRR